MKYTQLFKHNDLRMELNRMKKEPFNMDKCWEHPSYFAHHFLNLTPYRYQHMILRKYRRNTKKKLNNDRIIICKSRQIGISICLAALAIWYAATGVCKTGAHKNTKVGIISRSDDQAKKLMREIQTFTMNGKHGLPDLVDTGNKTPFTKKEFHFKGGVIKCFAPTRAAAGESFDLLILDEASFVDDEVLSEALEPTVSAVNGKIVLSSTPNGQKGFFWELFDPNDIRERHEYQRYWFNWKMCENDNQLKLIRSKQKFSKETGNTKSFDQEYNALFTVDEESFLEDADIEKGVDTTLSTVFEDRDSVCSLGLDYGLTRSATCISVVKHLGDKIILLFQFAAVNFDENLLMDENWEHSLPNLVKRYNIQHLVTDDCPMGSRTNRQLQNEGYPIELFNFRSDQFKGERNRGYYLWRTHLKKGNIKYPRFQKMISEMKCLQEIKMENGKYMRIKAPVNYTDDRCDSFMIACYPFLSESGSFKSTAVAHEAVDRRLAKPQKGVTRIDEEWDKINSKEYDFLLNGDKKK